jgi:ubiquinone/menaquinone biosynthesis C-methylase UbiE
MTQLDALYADLWSAHGDGFTVLDRSLGPRSWTLLFEVASAAGVHSDSLVVDAGCGRGSHCFELAGRFGCRAIGIDLVPGPLQAAYQSGERSSLVEFLQGNIEQLPVRTGRVDFVWCRDMLVHVKNPAIALAECARILRAGGKMLAWVTVETELMEPREAERLYSALAIEPLSVSRRHLEAAFQSAGLAISQTEDLGSELIEFYEEKDGRASRELMRIARMRRSRNKLIAEWGTARYESVHALYHWVVYHLLGKLSSGYYLLEKTER